MNKKLFGLVAGASAFALVLTGCNAAGKGGKPEIKTVDKTISYTTGKDEYQGYNSLMGKTYSTYNAAINDRMMTGFGYFNPDGSWHKGTDLGDYEMVSDNPLTVKYKVNEKAVYAGGTPITCEDFYLDWVSQNPQWILDGQKAAGKVDEKGDVAHLFDHVSGPETYAKPVKEGPQCNAGDREFTIVYSEPNPDWELVVSGPLPSHVVAKQIGLSKEELFKKLKEKDFATAVKAAAFWNNWLPKNPGQHLPADMTPSFGPYQLKADGWKAGEYVTLERNPDWWGQKAGTNELVYREIGDDAMLQALKNQDINVIEPQATVDTLEQLSKMEGVKTETGSTMIWEHLDYNFAKGSVFQGPNGQKLREAFAYCVPRQEIVDKLIKPLNKDAVVMNAREYFPTDSKYEEVVKASYDGRYDKVDIDKAAALIKESGVAKPKVRIGYNGNPRRAETVNLIKASCTKAGFEIADIGGPQFFTDDLPNGNYDIALFAWSGSGQVISGQNIYASNGGQNFGKYSNAKVDSEWNKVATSLDKNVHLESKKVIEKELWDTLFSIPLYAHPGIIGYSDGLINVQRNVTQSGVMWNADRWAWEAK